MSRDFSLRHSRKPVLQSLFAARHLAGVSRSASRFLPPQMLLLLSMLSVQLGAAFAKGLFPAIGSSGTVFLRLSFAALILMLLWRPRLRGYTLREYVLVALFGVNIAAMNGFFYASIARLPLGIAVTLEFVGPLGVALVESRRLPDVLWTLFAVAGVVLLAPIQGVALDPLGIAFALLAGGCWAAYILLNKGVGRVFEGGSGLALGMTIGAIAFVPFGITSLGSAWHDPSVLALGLGVAVLSSVIPFSLELEALRSLSARVYGVLTSLEPVVGAIVGLLVLGESVGLRAIIAMALIVIASGGVSLEQRYDKKRSE